MSCTTTLELGLIQPHTRLNYLPTRASLITSTAQEKKSAQKEMSTQSSKQAATVHDVPKLVTSQGQILQSHPDVFEGIGCFPCPPYHIQLGQNVTPKQTPCRPIPVHSKEAFQQDINKMVRVLRPVHGAIPWINSFVLIEGKNKLDNVKLRICLDPTNLNKVIVREPYHFKTPEDIAHLLADACIMSMFDCKKAIDNSSLMRLPLFLLFSTQSLENLGIQ